MSKEQETGVADGGTREDAAGATEAAAHESGPGAGTDSGAGTDHGAGTDSAAGTDHGAGSGNGTPDGAEDRAGRTRQSAETAAEGEEGPGEKPDGASGDAEEDERARLAEEAGRYKDRLVRLAAEFDNYKKRTGREFTALVKNAGESLIAELLPILDNIERALQAPQTSEETRSFAQGFEMIRQQFLEKLEKAGMKEIAAEGTPFDPTRHEAVMAVENEEHAADTVINVVEKGYTLNEKVLRAAKVIVTRAPAKAPDQAGRADRAGQADRAGRADRAGQADQAGRDNDRTPDPAEDE